MKRGVRYSVFIACFCFLLLLAGCNKAEARSGAGTSGGSESTRNKIVTFIELGSVNCIPCKMMQPVMEQLEENFPRDVEVIFYDVWTEEDKHRAGEYGIKVIPTQVFLDGEGVEFFRHEGFFPYDEIVDILEQQGVTD